MDDHEFVGIKFEWRGKTRQPWVDKGLDCTGLTNYYMMAVRDQMLRPSLISADGWSWRDIPNSYIRSKALAFDHMVTELASDDKAQATMIIYQGYKDRMCLAAINLLRPETALIFGADSRSHWIDISGLENVTYWKLKQCFYLMSIFSIATNGV